MTTFPDYPLRKNVAFIIVIKGKLISGNSWKNYLFFDPIIFLIKVTCLLELIPIEIIGKNSLIERINLHLVG